MGELEPVALSLEDFHVVHCQSLVDVIPGASLPDGEYVFQAQMQAERDGPGAESDVRFAVVSSSSAIDRAIDEVEGAPPRDAMDRTIND